MHRWDWESDQDIQFNEELGRDEVEHPRLTLVCWTGSDGVASNDWSDSRVPTDSSWVAQRGHGFRHAPGQKNIHLLHL